MPFLAQIQALKKALQQSGDKYKWHTSDLESALAFASMAAMINCERSGCKPPNQNEVHDRLRTELMS